jgi:LysM repeat protein
MADDLFPDKDRKDKVDKTTWIYIGLAAAALVLTYLIYEHGKSSGSSGSSFGTIVDPSLLNPSVAGSSSGSGSAYQPGTELQAYQQGLQDAIQLVQAQPGTGAESSSATTASPSSGANTSSATTAVSSSGTTTYQTSSAPAPAPVSHPASQRTVTVVSGDTLWGLAQQYGVSESSLYSANAGVLNSTAQQNGFANSAGGSRIWPGERLVIP